MRPALCLSALALVGLLFIQVSTVRAQSSAASPAPVDKMGEIAKSLGNDALELKTETEQGLKRLNELEERLKQNVQDTKNAGKTIDELLSLLGQAADRLKPEGVYRKTLKAVEDTVRDYANRAATDPDPEVRKLADSFKNRAERIAALGRDAEQLRTSFLAHIDRLSQQKHRLEFSTALAETDEFIKNARAYFDTLNNIAAGTKKLSDDIQNAFGTSKPTQ